MFVFGTHWQTRHPTVSQQTCTCGHKHGPEHVTNVQHVWSLTFISQVTTNSIVMWETQHNNADWDCFKTPILQEILKIRNRLQMERCVFLAVTCLFWEAGCVRIRRQFHTVQRNLRLFLLMQVYEWTVFPALDLWDLVIDVLHSKSNQTHRNQLARETRCITKRPRCARVLRTRHQFLKKTTHYHKSILFPHFSSVSPFVHLWGQRGCNKEDCQKEKSYNETCFQDPQSCSWLVVRVSLDWTQDPNQICRHQKPTRRLSDQRELHTWWMESSSLSLCWTSAFSALQAARKRCRKGCRREMVKKELPPNQNRWWIWYRVAWQSLQQHQVRLHLQARWVSELTVMGWVWWCGENPSLPARGNPLHGTRTKFRTLKLARGNPLHGIRSSKLIWRHRKNTRLLPNQFHSWKEYTQDCE